MKHIVGFSGGIDSQAATLWVLNRFPKEDVILLNSDAGGNEHPMTTEFIKSYSIAVHPVVMLTPTFADICTNESSSMDRSLENGRKLAVKKNLDPDALATFCDLAKLKGRWPASQSQFCTSKLKLYPTMRWIRANVFANDYIRYSGIRRSESDRRSNTPYSERDDWFECEIFHPIFDWEKQMCFDYVASHGQAINPLYKLGFNRVGCAPCVNSGRADIRNWAKRFPAMIDKVRSWETDSKRTFFAPMVPRERNQLD